jgi:hypothetical protein
VDRLSYHDWGLCSKDGVRQAVRNAAGRTEGAAHALVRAPSPVAVGTTAHAGARAVAPPGVTPRDEPSLDPPERTSAFSSASPAAADAHSSFTDSSSSSSSSADASSSSSFADTEPSPSDTPLMSGAAASNPLGAGMSGNLLRAGAIPARRRALTPAPSEATGIPSGATCSLLGAGAVLPLRGALTAVTSEGYGEATCATADRLIRLLGRMTEIVPCMRDWQGGWDLGPDSSFVDVGSGYGKVSGC